MAIKVTAQILLRYDGLMIFKMVAVCHFGF